MTVERTKTRSKALHAPQFLVSDDELRLIDVALEEDKGPGDWTTRWVVPARTRGNARIIAKADGVIAGLGIASTVFLRLDPRAEISTSLQDGSAVNDGDVVLTIKGPARTILTGER